MSDPEQQKKLKLAINGFLTGDSNQFRLIKTKITQYVYHQRFGSDVDRDEVVSEIIEILFENLSKNRFQGDSLSALNVYIYNIIRFRINRVFRRRSRLTYDDEPANREISGGSSPEHLAAAKDLAGKVMALIGEKCRELLRLKYQEQWSDEEISERLKKSKNATSTAISRCLKKAQGLEILQESR